MKVVAVVLLLALLAPAFSEEDKYRGPSE